MSKQTKAYLALTFICIVWGTTYLGIRLGVMHYPAFLFAGIRQAVGGIILVAIALMLNKNAGITKEQMIQNAIIGGLMITMGNGLVTWGEKYIPSGVSALICSLMPLVAVLINLVSSKKEHFNAGIGFGMLLGLAGVGIIFKDSVSMLSDSKYLAGMLCTLVATSSWALGSILSKKSTKQVNPMFNSGMQLLFGGIFLFIISPFVDSYENVEWANTEALLSLAYLIVMGSVIAYAAYNFTLSVLPVGVVTLYAYINPLVAVIMGYFWLNEKLDIYTLLAFVTIVISVYLVNRGYRKQHKTADNAVSALPAEHS